MDADSLMCLKVNFVRESILSCCVASLVTSIPWNRGISLRSDWPVLTTARISRYCSWLIRNEDF